jgi:glycine C-acetyltransferase
MNNSTTRFRDELLAIEQQGLFKRERVITTPQGVEIATREAGEVLNFCANNYLGLANHPELVRAATMALETHGFGMASVRFICGTQDLHKQLERAIAGFLQTDDAILYTSCFDANTGLFETLLGEEDAVISDQLNHASIIDGIRLCKAARYRYRHGDMADLEAQLEAAAGARTRLIATDGVFSMDGDLARLDEITRLAHQYDALVGKALGGGSGGFTAAAQPVVDLLRQRSRPYLFSNTLTPALAAAGIRTFELLEASDELRDRLRENTRYFRKQLTATGFDIRPGDHPIVPVMLYEASLAQQMAARLLAHGIYVIGFFHPVVPEGQARIRVQVSAAHTREHLDKAVNAFAWVGKELSVI